MNYKYTAHQLRRIAGILDKVAYVPKKYEHIDFKPPKGVADRAAYGLELRDEYGRGGLTNEEASEKGIGSGIQRARNLKNRDELNPDTVRRMKSFFDRHEAYKKHHKTEREEDGPSNSYISWLLWGDDEGRRWAEKIVRMMDAADEEAKEKK